MSRFGDRANGWVWEAPSKGEFQDKIQDPYIYI